MSAIRMFFLCVVIVSCFCGKSAIAQDGNFYKALNYYLSSNYTLALHYFDIAEQTNTDAYKADVFFLNGLCHYYTGMFENAMCKFEDASVYVDSVGISNKACYYDPFILMRYRAMSFDKLGQHDMYIAELQRMIVAFESDWARGRLAVALKVE